MEALRPVAFVFVLIYVHIVSIYGNNCPKNLPLEIAGECYRLQTDLFPFSKAAENCETLADNSKIVNFLMSTPEKLADEIKGFIKKQLEKTYYWIGFKTDDTDTLNKPIEEREWSFHIDDSTIKQKHFKFWADQPSDAALTCAVVNGSRDFKVVAVDCGGARLPVICMKKSDTCQDDQKPYLVYGDYCLAALNGALEYNKIVGACHPDAPTPMKNKDMKKYIVHAAMNSILGGAVFVEVKKFQTLYLFGSRPVPAEMWGEGEPRQNYACAGLALQMDGSVKLRTISCDAYAASLCHIRASNQN